MVLFNICCIFAFKYKRRMKKNWIILCAAIAVLTGCNQKMTQEERFLQIAERENLKCPVLMNGTTRFDSTRYDATANKVSYYYTLLGEADNAKKYQRNYENYRKALEKHVIGALEMKAYVDYGTTIQYVYYSDSTKSIIADFVFNSPN